MCLSTAFTCFDVGSYFFFQLKKCPYLIYVIYMVNNDIYNDHSSTFILTLFAYFYFCIWIYKPLLPFPNALYLFYLNVMHLWILIVHSFANPLFSSNAIFWSHCKKCSVYLCMSVIFVFIQTCLST